ncbi:ParB/RepB/Spo0J family partition protein [Noviherbaspirillum cavernae]|uniref:ParB/RepB/Spo0J family partition protein n=1 Tax=Noviherbaspirillum cavernae TaxID=2320862 RepID=A0A418WW88_9BURK|nr:ParB/RepB/Spo0J family partition protein [Noviherbaspirillum cavernae]RJF96869.1 ParB/RepB/Spo0J family partition protein [Noviherbaspirillum cavernae]
MSIKDRLSKKMEGLVVPAKGEPGAVQSPLRTGPGQMLMVNSLMKESNAKVAELEDRLKQFDGALPVRLIAPEKIVASHWANRSAQNFDTADFIALKDEIANAQGNVQPIKVRPVKGQDDLYEIVFGHRRHRACLELGLPVLAMVEEVSDAELFKEMDRENRARLDLSPWEQGMMYRRALDEKLFASQEQLAKELGIDAGNLSKALKLATLDSSMVDAFSSPLDLQYRWAKPLAEALKADQAAVLLRAKMLKEKRQDGLSAKGVFDALVGTPAKAGATEITIDGEVRATITHNGDDVSIRFAKGAVGVDRVQELKWILEEWLKG